MEYVFKPKWKGKIASTPYAATLTDLANPSMLGEEYMTNYVQKLSKHIGGLIRCDALDRITTGEFVMLAFDCGGNDAQHQRETLGAPVNSISVKEASRLNLVYLGIPKTSQAPNAATLFIDFIHSREGQQLYWKYDRTDLHVYPESNTYAPVQKMLKSGGKVSVGTIEEYLENFEFGERIRNKFRDILRK
jgi:ABC-type Fe3+ transport system substrate-binding protein